MSSKPGKVKKKTKRGDEGRKERTPLRLPMLYPGIRTNFWEWSQAAKEQVSIRYGELGLVFTEDEYVHPPDVDESEYNLDDDEHGIQLSRLKRAWDQRDKRVAKLEAESFNAHYYLWSHMSKESQEAAMKVQALREDPHDFLQLWLAVKQTHCGGVDTTNAMTRRSNAKVQYRSVRMKPYETLTEYRLRFGYALEVYQATGNVELPEEEIADDYYQGLDRARYSKFIADVENDKSKGIAQPATLEDMHQRALDFVVPANPHRGATASAVFSTKAEDGKSKGDRKKQSKNLKGEKKSSEGKRTVVCWHCNEQGHVKSQCPQRDNSSDVDELDGSDGGIGLVTHVIATGRSFATSAMFQWYHVLLDNQADTSVVHPRLLTGVIKSKSVIHGLGGSAVLPYVGTLRGFFKCKSGDNLMASVLCFADVERLYPISYEQGVSFTVHMKNRDLVFWLRDKFYVADMREWSKGGARALVTTVTANESRYSRAEVQRARTARELVTKSGFSSERDVLGLVNDGNVLGVPVTANDVRRSFEIYGKSPGALRGRRTEHKVTRASVDESLTLSRDAVQRLYADVMHAGGLHFVVSIALPLDLLMIVSVPSTKSEALGSAVQTLVDTLTSRGFRVGIVHLDSQPGFVPLRGRIPGVEIDIGGAGDHMARVDVNIRRLKEIMRSVISELPWEIPMLLIKYLAFYAVSRRNLRRTTRSAVCPRVEFTGRKPNYKRELTLGFGDYCECYDPAAKGNRVDRSRTEPCVALYPAANATGSWYFWNLKSSRVVLRSNWQVLPTSDLVISAMNATALSQRGSQNVVGAEESAFLKSLCERMTLPTGKAEAIVEAIMVLNRDSLAS